jgi:hypothetical protein
MDFTSRVYLLSWDALHKEPKRKDHLADGLTKRMDVIRLCAIFINQGHWFRGVYSGLEPLHGI